jgi:hypothetical protein
LTQLDDLIDALPEQAAAHPSLERIGRFCTTEFLLDFGDTAYHLVIERGRLVEVVRGPLRMRAWRFAIRAEPDTWMRFWQREPTPGFNDIFALVSGGHARIEGDIGPLLENLRFVKELLALPRAHPSVHSGQEHVA